MDELIEWCEKQIKFLEETAGMYDNQADMEWFAEIVKALRELQSLRESDDKRLQQIKDRIPIYMAEKVEDWPQLLTTISQLKQDRNNYEVWYEEQREENERLREDLNIIAKGVVDSGLRYEDRDWACAECHPSSDILIDGFQCYYHRAKKIMEADHD